MEGPGGNELAGVGLAGIELADNDLAGIELAGIELVRVSLPLRRSWVSGAGQFSHRDSLLVRAVLSVPVMAGGRQEFEGWGECGAFPGPTYTSEYTAGAVEVSGEYLVPALFRAGASRAVDVGP